MKYYGIHELEALPIGSVVFDADDDPWTNTREDWWVYKSTVDDTTLRRSSSEMWVKFGPITDVQDEPQKPLDIGEFELTLTVRALRQIKAEVWDECWEYAEDLFAMPTTRYNPYREGRL